MADRVTMADVAREVGVSPMTVSRVVNNKGEVSEATRQRVKEAIKRLGYRPSGIARSLATQHTGTLGLVVPDIANPFFAEVARGVEHVAHAEGYNVFLCNTDEDPQREVAVLGSLEEMRVDGIVLCSSRLPEEELRAAIASHPAVVLVNRRLLSAAPDVGSVLVDDVYGGKITTRHLLRWHRAIGFLAGPPESHSGRRRLRGYREALQAAGVAYCDDWVCHCRPMVETGRERARALLLAHPDLTALLCYNDLVAVGALRACVDLGRRVPEDVVVAGFDDIFIAALVSPPLTTCHIPRGELGAQAVRMLLHTISASRGRGNGAGSTEIILQPQLIIRASAPE